jgi:hypothetical protein
MSGVLFRSCTDGWNDARSVDDALVDVVFERDVAVGGAASRQDRL